MVLMAWWMLVIEFPACVVLGFLVPQPRCEWCGKRKMIWHTIRRGRLHASMALLDKQFFINGGRDDI